MTDELHCSVGKGLMKKDQRRQRKVTLAKSKKKGAKRWDGHWKDQVTVDVFARECKHAGQTVRM